MAKTFKLTVSFPMSLVVSDEVVKDFQEARIEARSILTSGKVLKGESKFRVELLGSDKPDDEVLETVFRAGVRQVLREDFLKEVCGNESKGRMGDVRVVFEKAPKRSCQGCIETNCVKSEKDTNAGCADKRVGLRDPV